MARLKERFSTHTSPDATFCTHCSTSSEGHLLSEHNPGHAQTQTLQGLALVSSAVRTTTRVGNFLFLQSTHHFHSRSSRACGGQEPTRPAADA